MMRPIDAGSYADEILKKLKKSYEMYKSAKTEDERNCWKDIFMFFVEAKIELDNIPTVDAIPIKVIESWIYSIAINNVGHKFGGGTFEECCEEIIKRLDGLVRYNADWKEGEHDDARRTN